VQVDRKDFTITGANMSKSAISGVMKVYANDPNFVFVTLSILDSMLNDDEYDYVFDRLWFPVLQPIDITRYVKSIEIILKDNAMLFLKCLSTEEKR
jgi:hypothetical protein